VLPERAELLSIVTETEPTRLPACHGYQNCCSCPRCLRRAQRSGCACECHIEHPDALGHCFECRPRGGRLSALDHLEQQARDVPARRLPPRLPSRRRGRPRRDGRGSPPGNTTGVQLDEASLFWVTRGPRARNVPRAIEGPMSKPVSTAKPPPSATSAAHRHELDAIRASHEGERTTMETSGGMARPRRPDPADIKLRDIARSLSLVCRFGGHIPFHWSVADHALLVRRWSSRRAIPSLPSPPSTTTRTRPTRATSARRSRSDSVRSWTAVG
jgi:hypothetical protein